MIVVLSGDPEGHRILKSAELIRGGFAPAAIVSNGRGFTYGRGESDLAVAYAVGKGASSEAFIQTDWAVQSTTEESHAVVELLRQRGDRDVILVTTSWHTARAARIFRRRAPEIKFHVVGADDPKWHDGDWWVDRQGRKLFFMEAVKTIADYLGI